MKHRIQATARQWYAFSRVAEDTDEATIYDEIGLFGVTADSFIRDLKKSTASNLTVRINSPGGDVFDGIAITNALREHAGTVTVVVDGYAASIASIIMLGGDRVIAAPNSYVMIHNPWTVVAGDANELRKQADVLTKIEGTLADEYAAKTKRSADQIKAAMAQETWFNAQEALDFGLIDEISGTASANASAPIAITARVRPVGAEVEAAVEIAAQDEQVQPSMAAVRERSLRLREKYMTL